jgi:hypothetical protein
MNCGKSVAPIQDERHANSLLFDLHQSPESEGFSFDFPYANECSCFERGTWKPIIVGVVPPKRTEQRLVV